MDGCGTAVHSEMPGVTVTIRNELHLGQSLLYKFGVFIESLSVCVGGTTREKHTKNRDYSKALNGIKGTAYYYCDNKIC